MKSLTDLAKQVAQFSQRNRAAGCQFWPKY